MRHVRGGRVRVNQRTVGPRRFVVRRIAYADWHGTLPLQGGSPTRGRSLDCQRVRVRRRVGVSLRGAGRRAPSRAATQLQRGAAFGDDGFNVAVLQLLRLAVDLLELLSQLLVVVHVVAPLPMEPLAACTVAAEPEQRQCIAQDQRADHGGHCDVLHRVERSEQCARVVQRDEIDVDVAHDIGQQLVSAGGERNNPTEFGQVGGDAFHRVRGWDPQLGRVAAE
eukprot:5911610-Prymnesium_polylepis.2